MHSADNDFGAAGATAVGDALRGHTALQTLGLGGELVQRRRACVCGVVCWGVVWCRWCVGVSCVCADAVGVVVVCTPQGTRSVPRVRRRWATR